MNVYIPSSLHAVGDENVAHLSLPSLEQPTHVGQEVSQVSSTFVSVLSENVNRVPLWKETPLCSISLQSQSSLACRSRR